MIDKSNEYYEFLVINFLRALLSKSVEEKKLYN